MEPYEQLTRAQSHTCCAIRCLNRVGKQALLYFRITSRLQAIREITKARTALARATIAIRTEPEMEAERELEVKALENGCDCEFCKGLKKSA